MTRQAHLAVPHHADVHRLVGYVSAHVERHFPSHAVERGQCGADLGEYPSNIRAL